MLSQLRLHRYIQDYLKGWVCATMLTRCLFFSCCPKPTLTLVKRQTTTSSINVLRANSNCPNWVENNEKWEIKLCIVIAYKLELQAHIRQPFWSYTQKYPSLKEKETTFKISNWREKRCSIIAAEHIHGENAVERIPSHPIIEVQASVLKFSPPSNM